MSSSEQQELTAIIDQLDRWVESHGSRRYVPNDYFSTADRDFSLVEDYGIQQVRDEIRAFVELLIARKRRGHALEVGLGYFGSTHFLWRLVFRHVSTIECQKERTFLFRENCRKHFGKHLLDDGKSSFFFGYSCAPAILRSVRDHVVSTSGGLDMLFVDGDHRYEGVLADWLLYSHLVLPGGIVAFHDAVACISGAGVPKLLAELSAGTIDGIKRDVQQIVFSKDCGIAYYVQTATTASA